MKENESLTDEQKLAKAEELIERKELDKAQEVLDEIDEESGRKCYLQSLIYKEKFWYNEQRKMLKKAIKAEPDNPEYRQALEDLNAFRKTKEYRQSKANKRQMGDTDEMTELCCQCGGECCGTLLCQAICEGCS